MEGLKRFKARTLALAGPKAEAALRRANELNARDFHALVLRIVPRGDPEGGQLADTLRIEARPPTGTAVSIGSDAHPYPFHLEFGHKLPDGTHVPGKAYWVPAKRVSKKKMQGRLARAERLVIKAAAAAGAGGSNE